MYEKVILQVEVTSEAKREEEMSKSDFISLSFKLCDKIILPVGAYIEYTYKIDKVRSVTRRFSLLEPYEPTQVNETSWKYTPEFQHPKMLLSKIPFYILTNNSKGETIKQTSWAFNGSPLGIMDKVCKFLNEEIGFADKGCTKSVKCQLLLQKLVLKFKLYCAIKRFMMYFQLRSKLKWSLQVS